MIQPQGRIPFQVRKAVLDDISGWLSLAREVEPLFGPMVADPAFREGLERAIRGGDALCIRSAVADEAPFFAGGVVISRERNEILWLAVCSACRGRGIASALLSHAIAQLDPKIPISVTTFDRTLEAGLPARGLYHRFGFRAAGPGETNPAGHPTEVLRRAPRPHSA